MTDPVTGSVPDVVGIGFGPSNLALAIAVAEHNATADRPLRARFLERQREFGWHRGMLIPDARMQVSFLKDLATLRNPVSTFGFLNYLAERGRLVDFLNRQTFFPTRLEFHDYLAWAADRMADVVDYGTEVRSVEPASADERGPLLRVTATGDDGPVTLLTRAVVVATGLAPHLPDGVRLSERVWHNSDLVPNVARHTIGPEPRRAVVVGAGQSAAESVDYLHRTFADAEVCAVFDRWGYSAADDSAFANRVFDPDAADAFHRSPDDVRDRIVAVHRNTNYAAVEPDLITALYERHYAERVAGRERLRFLNMSTVERLEDLGHGLKVGVRSGVDGSWTDLDADVVVYATGYRSGDPARFLRGVSVVRDERGRPCIDPGYRLHLDDPDAAPVFVQGATEHTHGLGSTLLSNVAVRGGEILDGLLAGRSQRDGLRAQVRTAGAR